MDIAILRYQRRRTKNYREIDWPSRSLITCELGVRGATALSDLSLLGK